MKKTLIAVAAAAALATTSAFAEITFGLGAHEVLVPVAYDGVDEKAGLVQTWGTSPRVGNLGFNAVSEDEKAGVTATVRWDGAKKATWGDDAYAWVKPIDQVELKVGQFDGGTNGFREGAGNFGIWNYLRASKKLHDRFLDGDAAIMDGTVNAGLIANIFPIEGLKIMTNIPFANWDDDAISGTKKAYDAYRYFQAGVAYTIEGIGTAKVLWTNKDVKYEDYGDDDTYHYYGNLGVAFDITAVENLYVAVGVKKTIGDAEAVDGADVIKQLVKDEALRTLPSLSAGTQIAVNASYTVMDPLKVYAAGGIFISDWDDVNPLWGIAVGVDYSILDNLILNADVRYAGKTSGDAVKVLNAGKDVDDVLGFLVGAKYVVNSNAAISVGFEGVTKGAGFKGIDAGKKKNGKTYDGFMWSIPVVFDINL